MEISFLEYRTSFTCSGRRINTYFILGSDRMGRDQWSRLMYATKTSLTVGMVSVLISVLLGVLLGGISGYFGERRT
jgi:ABC-type dipeptide/oligopeptide/nickel transport system permease subunit